MKAQHLVPVLALALTACSSTRAPLTSSLLSPERARVVARQLANERAQTLFRAQPFWDGAPARFVHGEWVWSDRRACGGGDMEAMVVLAADGTPRSVDVMLLYSRPVLF